MTLTLGQARVLLAEYADGGSCADSARVVSRINEAQQRLHSIRPWMGLMARYAVVVNSNTFTVPTALESVSRVTKYVGSAPAATTSGALITDGVAAFLSDSQSILSLNFFQGTARTYTTPSGIAAVDVQGKRAFVPAVQDSDELLISDFTALKFMLLAIWRENNDMLSAAVELEKKAIERMTYLTDSHIEVARKINYQTRVVNSPAGTMGWTRARIALDLEGGLHFSDSEIFDKLNASVEMAVNHYNFLARQESASNTGALNQKTFVYVDEDSDTLAYANYEVLKLLFQSQKANDGASVMQYKKEAFDLIERNLKQEVESGRTTIWHTNLTLGSKTFGHFKARIGLSLGDAGYAMSDAMVGRWINKAEETLFNSGKWELSTKEHKFEVTEDGLIALPETIGSVLYASIEGEPIVIRGEEFDFHINGPGHSGDRCRTGAAKLTARGESAGKRVFYISAGCYPSCVRFFCKDRWTLKASNSDLMQITQYPAIETMVRALVVPELNARAMLQDEALKLLERKGFEDRGGERRQLQVESYGFMMGDVSQPY